MSQTSLIQANMRVFRIPLLVVGGIILFLFLEHVLHQTMVGKAVMLIAIFVGSIDLIRETVESLRKGKFALDYIALLAITTGVLTQEYLVSGVIVLMLSGGNALEYYANILARRSLVSLADRIPHTVHCIDDQEQERAIQIESVQVGDHIFVRKGEVIPLDGRLITDQAVIDESTLTGEPFPVNKVKDDVMRSGTVNVGNSVMLVVTHADQNSSYRKIIQMVEAAQREKSPFIRLADRYSTVFTIITVIIAIGAYAVSHDPLRILAVLVIATPCPLILATPIALMGGMNAAAKRRIIFRKLAVIEVLSKVTTMIFDKTGTITLGEPTLVEVKILDDHFSSEQIVSIAAGLERNSLHPLGKTIVKYANQKSIQPLHFRDVHEEIGFGITGSDENGDGRHVYQLAKAEEATGLTITLKRNGAPVAQFEFQDQIKAGSIAVMQALIVDGLSLHLFTGDEEHRALEVSKQLGVPMVIKANCLPEDKRKGIAELKKQGKVTAMIGDGINDAPALALADVGMVFSNNEQTAASEAADVVLLGNDFGQVRDAVEISCHTIKIARQSIFVGIGLSVFGMLCAAFGIIPPIVGAIFQEIIDVSVILNALRAARFSQEQ